MFVSATYLQWQLVTVSLAESKQGMMAGEEVERKDEEI